MYNVVINPKRLPNQTHLHQRVKIWRKHENNVESSKEADASSRSDEIHLHHGQDLWGWKKFQKFPAKMSKKAVVLPQPTCGRNPLLPAIYIILPFDRRPEFNVPATDMATPSGAIHAHDVIVRSARVAATDRDWRISPGVSTANNYYCLRH